MVFEYSDRTTDETLNGLSRITVLWQDVVSYTLMADYTHDKMDVLDGIDFAYNDGLVESDIIKIYGISGKIRSRNVSVTDFKPLL